VRGDCASATRVTPAQSGGRQHFGSVDLAQTTSLAEGYGFGTPRGKGRLNND
jgi:hypothetical protein